MSERLVLLPFSLKQEIGIDFFDHPSTRSWSYEDIQDISFILDIYQ